MMGLIYLYLLLLLKIWWDDGKRRIQRVIKAIRGPFVAQQSSRGMVAYLRRAWFTFTVNAKMQLGEMRAAYIESLFLILLMVAQAVIERYLPPTEAFGLRVITGTALIPESLIFVVIAINAFWLTFDLTPRQTAYGFAFTTFYTVVLIYGIQRGEILIVGWLPVLYLLRGNAFAIQHILERYQRTRLTERLAQNEVAGVQHDREIAHLRQEIEALQHAKRSE
ncbi:MAG: hypothetical protein AAF787_00010 [Chloroflexota bacterium]